MRSSAEPIRLVLQPRPPLEAPQRPPAPRWPSCRRRRGVLAHMLVGVDEPLSDEELADLEALTAAATPGPWVAALEEEQGIGGSSMIQLGLPGDFPPDIYVLHDDETAPSADLKFIAAARNYLPRLLAELRQRRGRVL